MSTDSDEAAGPLADRDGDARGAAGDRGDAAAPLKPGLSRRMMLTAGALGAAAAAGGVGAAARAQDGPAAPAVNTGALAGMPFRAYVRHGREGELLDLRLRGDIGPTQVVVRMHASCGCYTVVSEILVDRDYQTPLIPNHSGMGVVEAVGPQVRRVRPGDRVLVSGTPWCGQCKQCLAGTPEFCNYIIPGAVPNNPIADMADGTGVIQSAMIGGLSEVMVAYEEYCVPIFSDLPDEQIAMLGDTGGVGLAAVSVYDPVEFGQNVIIFGAGPIGLAATQGAKAKGAGRIIVIDPVAYRRELALGFGATHVFDPNEDTDGLVQRVRDACAAPTDRIDSGGQVDINSFTNVRGGDLVVECSGKDWLPPAVERGPDPSGLLALRQSWEVTAAGGSLVTMAIQDGEISFPASAFCLSGKRLFGGQMAGMNVLRDTIRFIALMEAGHVDIGALITSTHPLTEVREGFQKVSDRTEVAVVFTGA